MFGGKPQLWSAGTDPEGSLKQGLYLCFSLNVSWPGSCPCTVVPWCPVAQPPAHLSPMTTRQCQLRTQPPLEIQLFSPPPLVSRIIGLAKMVLAWPLLCLHQHLSFHIFILVLTFDPAMGENELKDPQHLRSPSLSFSVSIFILLKFIFWTRTCQ